MRYVVHILKQRTCVVVTFLICYTISNNISILDINLLCVKQFLKNICMIFVFPDIVLQKIQRHAYVFFAVRLDTSLRPTRCPIWKCTMGFQCWLSCLQTLSCFNCVNTEKPWLAVTVNPHQGNLAYRDRRYSYYRISSLCRITPSKSTTQRDKTWVTIAGNSLLNNIPSEFMSKNMIRLPCNRCREKSARLFTQLGHECRRQCQLLQRNTVNRLYARNTPWVLVWVPCWFGSLPSLVEAYCIIQEKHISHGDSSKLFSSYSFWRTRLF